MARPVVMSTDSVLIVALKYQFPLTEKRKQDSKFSWKKNGYYQVWGQEMFKSIQILGKQSKTTKVMSDRLKSHCEEAFIAKDKTITLQN